MTEMEYETAKSKLKQTRDELFNLKIQYELSKQDIEEQNKLKNIIEEKYIEYKNLTYKIVEYEKGDKNEKYKRRWKIKYY